MMKNLVIAISCALAVAGVSSASASAQEWTPLKRGDVFERPAEGYTISALRAELRDHGYKPFGSPNKFGALRDFIVIAPDNHRYRISVTTRTGEVLKVHQYVQ